MPTLAFSVGGVCFGVGLAIFGFGLLLTLPRLSQLQANMVQQRVALSVCHEEAADQQHRLEVEVGAKVGLQDRLARAGVLLGIVELRVAAQQKTIDGLQVSLAQGPYARMEEALRRKDLP